MIIVVEGKNDCNKIKSVFPMANVLITNGSAVDLQLIEMLKSLSLHHEIILCLDPDYAGERIRTKISKAIPSAKHVYAHVNEAISRNGKKVGIEHMSNRNIMNMFSNIKTPAKNDKFVMQDLFDMGLAGGSDSRELRVIIGKKLNIGYSNAKQFLYRLNMVDITKKDLRSLYDCK